MADLATLQARLAEAESAYHQLLIGKQSVEVQHGDMRRKYTEADVAALSAYIADLRAQIASLGGATTGERRRGMVVDL